MTVTLMLVIDPRLVGNPEAVMVLSSMLVPTTSGLFCWKVPRVLLVNDTVVGVVTGPVADNVVDCPRQMFVAVAFAVTVGEGFTFTD